MGRESTIYVLRFSALVSLTRAFDRIQATPEITSCSFEPGQRQVRLLAQPTVAEALVERLYQEGGLAWVSRHPLEEQGLSRRGSRSARPSPAPGPRTLR